MELSTNCKKLMYELGLAKENSPLDVSPLTGGVSSDIARVEVDGRVYCAKFALSKLKVKEDWNAPVHRNKAEYEWLKIAAAIAPESTMKLFGRSETLHGFAMEFLSGDDIYLWKTALLEETSNWDESVKVGELIGRIHSESALKGFDKSQFYHRDDFYALRIEPYLVFTSESHPEVSVILKRLADQLYEAENVLVHGDVSPKNILFRDGKAIILDAECATMGDPAFDVAFALNHLLLKAIHIPTSTSRLLESVLDFWSAYHPSIHWETSADLEERICQLLPALMLARVDGKSPVEYLSEHNRKRVRMMSLNLIQQPVQTLKQFVRTIAQQLEEKQT
ncbi:aminoglycoside phosphotransferase family protein [Cocleimonas sp. KMM 6892]|uniref:phosphotransferase family protein n=1 Tax=unclassified Cocleimonas TaxID=2639732 RepID=UPI002DBB9E40|nr:MULTISPECIES: aminoglycoside phosphotransferase family protein [unclassified Cocleimonas]MEB8432624.1 aminoglycoside phosphotransferase family protein [Cocleimonas sp. KMM 6892]MEC4715483.1 aminoglycoside phosphotransferase family protein [Cocleimonas sp. KMM 6895]MEC4744899.1 aminoglycoside phosphotransferase family protein [Cocleimonas sp. KMM 6896]